MSSKVDVIVDVTKYISTHVHVYKSQAAQVLTTSQSHHMTNHSCPHRLLELATYSDYFSLDTTERSGSKTPLVCPEN